MLKLHWLLLIDGQKIAKRLSTSITKETTLARKLLSDYNTLTGSSTKVTLAEVLSLDADFWKNPQLSTGVSSDISWSTKKDIIQAYLLVKRSEEELLLLSEEKENVLSYWSDQKKAIEQQLATTTESFTQYTLGSRALLQKRLSEIDLMYSTASVLFTCFSVDHDSGITTADESWSPYDSDLESLSDDLDIILP